MIWVLAAKLVGSLIGAALWVCFDGPSYAAAAAIGILPIWLELAATRLTGCEPSLEKRLLWRAVDNGVDAASLVVLPAAWFACVTRLGWPAYAGLAVFAGCGLFRLIRFVRKGLLGDQFFEGLPVTYTGYAWVVLAARSTGGTSPGFNAAALAAVPFLRHGLDEADPHPKDPKPAMTPLAKDAGPPETPRWDVHRAARISSGGPTGAERPIEAYQLPATEGEARRDASGRGPLPADKHLPASAERFAAWAIGPGVPLLTKAELLDRPAADRLSRRYAVQDLIVSKSSGSSGQALDVYYDRESFRLFVLAGFRLYWMAFAYLPWHRQTYIYTSPYSVPLTARHVPHAVHLRHSPRSRKPWRNCGACPPHLLVCYPSHFVQRRSSIRWPPRTSASSGSRAVNLNSEMSSAAERKYLSEKLRCFVFDDYSSEELTRIASQVPAARFLSPFRRPQLYRDRGRRRPSGPRRGRRQHRRQQFTQPSHAAAPLRPGGPRLRPDGPLSRAGRNFRLLEKLGKGGRTMRSCCPAEQPSAPASSST